MARSPIARLKPAQYGVMLLSIVLLWPALINRAPFFLGDTTAYVRGADAIVAAATGRHSEWSIGAAPATAGTATVAPVTIASASAPRSGDTAAKPVLLGRSVYYGMLLYAGVAAGSFWLPVLVQALIAGACLTGMLRHFVDPNRAGAFAIAAILLFSLAALTPLPFFVSTLMPDLFTGLAILAAAALAGGWARERPVARFTWLTVLGAAAAFHSSNILVITGLACALVPASVIVRQRIPWRLAVAWVATAALGLASEAAFSVAVRHATGQPPIRPPFVTARLVADEAGARFLREHCPASRFLACRFVDRLPIDSDAFLWRTGDKGAYMTLSFADQREIAAEEPRFVLAVLRDQPIAAIAGLTGHFAEQIGMIRLGEFNLSPRQHGFYERKVPAATLATIERSRGYASQMPVGLVEAATLPLTLLAALILAACLFVPRGHAARPYAATAIGGLLLNDLVCACLSSPHDRYQMRAIWVLPIIAALILADRRGPRRGASPGSEVSPVRPRPGPRPPQSASLSLS